MWHLLLEIWQSVNCFLLASEYILVSKPKERGKIKWSLLDTGCNYTMLSTNYTWLGTFSNGNLYRFHFHWRKPAVTGCSIINYFLMLVEFLQYFARARYFYCCRISNMCTLVAHWPPTWSALTFGFLFFSWKKKHPVHHVELGGWGGGVRPPNLSILSVWSLQVQPQIL